MSDYRRYFVPGGTCFFTLVAYRCRPRFARPSDIQRFRDAVAFVQREQPFRFVAAVVLPDHVHFIWTLPPGDSNYSRRIGRMKVLFTRTCDPMDCLAAEFSESRRKHRDSDVWQRRFWEHTIDEPGEFEAFLDYIHYNPVKHGYTTCPHAWPASSFSRWVARGLYDRTWGCCCERNRPVPRDFAKIEGAVGEP